MAELLRRLPPGRQPFKTEDYCGSLEVGRSASPTRLQARLVYLVSEAEHFYLRGKYQQALERYNAAVYASPDDRQALLGRSATLMKLAQPQNALDDLSAILATQPDHTEAMLMKGDALYACGRYELALVVYFRGMKLYTEQSGFRDGFTKAQVSLEKSYNHSQHMKEARHHQDAKKSPLNDQKIVYLKSLHKKLSSQPHIFRKGPNISQAGLPLVLPFIERTQESVRRIHRYTFKRNKVYHEKTRHRHSHKRRMCDKLPAIDNRPPSIETRGEKGQRILKKLSPDKLYLERLKKECDDESMVSQYIAMLADRGLGHLRQFYNHLRLRGRKSPYPWESRPNTHTSSYQNVPELSRDPIQSKVDNAAIAYEEGRFRQCLRIISKYIPALAEKTEDKTRRYQLMDFYNYMGRCRCEMGEYELAINAFKEELAIADKNVDKPVTSRALADLGVAYLADGQFRCALETLCRKARMCVTSEECVWVYYELAVCYFMLNKYPQSDDAATKCLTASLSTTRFTDISLKALVLLAMVKLELGDVNDAIKRLREGLTLAEKLGDKEICDVINSTLHTN